MTEEQKENDVIINMVIDAFHKLRMAHLIVVLLNIPDYIAKRQIKLKKAKDKEQEEKKAAESNPLTENTKEEDPYDKMIEERVNFWHLFSKITNVISLALYLVVLFNA